MNRVIWMLGLVLLSACQAGSNKEKAKPIKMYFSLEDFFTAEIDRLTAVSPVKKVVVFNGEKETHQLDTIDWQQELRPFLKSDFNKRSWLNKFEVDTSRLAQSNQRQVSYLATEEDIPIKKVVLTVQEGEVTHIDIERSNKTTIAQFDQSLQYDPKSGFSVRHFQKSLLSKPQDLLIEMSWARN